MTSLQQSAVGQRPPGEEPLLARRAFVAGLGGLAVLAMARRASAFAPDAIGDLDIEGAPGAAFAVVERGRILALGGKGERAGPGTPPPDADTLFEIGSLTKTFTASLIFELQEEGRLGIEERIGSYVDGLPDSWRALSLASLLTHTSGLPNYINPDNFMELMPQDLTPRELIALVADQPMTAPPGHELKYNNTGFILLGLAAEAVSGRSYWEELDRRFFQVAGMRSTGPRRAEERGPDVARGYFWKDGRFQENTPISAPGSTWAAGGLLSTAADLARWPQALDAGAVLSPSVRDAMWRPARLARGEPAGWGYGWMMPDAEGRTVVAHGGGTAGFSCWLSRDVERELTVIALTNQNGLVRPTAMADRLAAVVAPRRA